MIVQVIDNMEPGGAQEIVRCLALYGARCRVLCVSGEGSLLAMLREAGVDCRSLAPRKWLFPLSVLRLLALTARLPSGAVVNAHLDLTTLVMCALRRLFQFRLVVTVHALQAQWPRWYVPLFRALIGAADHVVVEDQIGRREVIECGVAPEKVTLIPIGTDKVDQPGRPADKDIRRSFDIPAHRPILLNVARMVPAKGQAHLIRALALAKHADPVAIIVGDGPEAERLRALAKQLGIADRVIFPGTRTDLHNFYAAAAAFIMPCLDESMGVVIYESLACGVPVIAYDSGSIAEVIRDGVNGYLVPPDPGALAGRIDWFLDHKPTLDFSAVADHSARGMCERYGRVYALMEGQSR